MSNIFEIENLSCAYKNSNKVVLQIDKLVIPEKKILAILGISGVGKSTLLETLGLMNNTLKLNQEVKYLFKPEKESFIDLKDIWNKPDKEISYLRNKYFSFIFQDTNLMPNFSIYENICLTLMLQGYSKQESEKLTDEYLVKTGLGEVAQNQKIYELSGGQRQRVAFIRAVAPNFKVIFGDEPTGNLDRITSRVLMKLLYDEIKDKDRTAVIVTHDVELSIEFSDQIIVINKEFQSINGDIVSYGLINNEFVFEKDPNNENNWITNEGKSISSNDLSILIKNLLSESNLKNKDDLRPIL